MLLNRRAILAGSTAAASVALPALQAIAKTADWDVEWRGTTGVFERLPHLDVESDQDFYRGFRYWINNDLMAATRRRAVEILKQNGIAPDENIPLEQVMDLMENDHIMGLSVMAWENTQITMWRQIQAEYHAEADLYLGEMEKAAKLGPGTLELHPEMFIPEYASYEIHLQPGGYVGDPFAGYIYVHGENVVFRNGNYQDDAQVRLSRAVPAPADGRVERVLEQGCSSGQFTVALKRKWPDAEVWGTDVGAPMVNFAHMRSVDLGVETHYLHELSEDSQFPDGYFDVVTNNLVFHEVPADIARGIISEAYRTLRPGGVFYPVDLFTSNPPSETAFGKFWAWRDYRWNEEVWRMEYTALDLVGEMRKVGFDVNEDGPRARRGGKGNVMGTKPA